MAFKDDISMQEYYGSFPTTSKATAVSRQAGVRKISVTPRLNAVGPIGDEMPREEMDRIPSPANPNRGPANIGPTKGSGTPNVTAYQQGGSSSQTGGSDTPKAGASVKSKANLYFLSGAALLLALLLYRKLKK
tara:strand:+ start:22903 stop:23301 length:399 start_codon:yes stop_codon:yes gene_type:complete